MPQATPDVRALDAFLVPPCGFGVVISRVGDAACFVRMQNGAEGLVPASAVAPLMESLRRQCERPEEVAG